MGGGGGILSPITNAVFGKGDDSGNWSQDQSANLARGAAGRNQQTITDILPQQRQFGQQLAQNATSGAAPVTSAMLNQATDRQLSQQYGAMQANRSVNPALAQRQFAQSAAQQHQATAQAAGVQGLQENQMNQQAFQNYLNSAYGAEQGAIGGSAQASNALAQSQQANQARSDTLNMGLIKAAGSAMMPTAGAAPTGAWTGGQILAQPHGPSSILGQWFHGNQESMKSGGVVPGQAQLSGDHPQNDTVPTMLSPGEVVIPKSIMEGKKPAEAAARFVRAVMAKKGMQK